MKNDKKNRAIITVVGEDRVGIVARVTDFLAKNQINIEDLNQTIMDGMFTMVMLVDLDRCKLDIKSLSVKLSKVGKEIGQEIHVHDEEIMKAMHRI